MRRILIILIFFILHYNCSANKDNIDSLKASITQLTNDTLILNTYLNISEKYIHLNNDSSLVYATKALSYSKKNNHIKWETIALSKIGAIQFNLGNLSQALKNYNESLILSKKNNFRSYTALNYKLIGALYGYQKEYQHALEYQFKALDIYLSTNDTISTARTYDNIAVYYRRISKYDSSLFYLNKAIVINSQINNYRSLGFNYNNKASYYLAKNDYQKAEIFFKKSLTIRKKHKLEQDLIQSYNNIGKLYHNIEQFDKAIFYFKQAIKVSEDIKIIKHLPLFYENLSKTYLKLENYTLALKYKKHQKKLNDSINNTETQILIINAEIEKEKMEEEYQNLLLETEVKDVKKSITKRTILIIILLIIIIIAFYIVIYSIKRYKLQEKLNKNKASILAIQGAEKVLKEKEKAAQKINNAQGLLKTEIKNLLSKKITLNLKNIQNLLSNYKAHNSKEKEIINQGNKHLTDAIHFVNQINSTLQIHTFEDKLLTKSIQSYLNNTFSNLNIQTHFSYTEEKTINQLDKELRKHIYLIIQEICTNALKHSKANIINIKIETKKKIKIQILDNGIGFDKASFKSGLGFSNLKYRALLYNGSVKINSKINEGTEIIIILDYQKV